MIPSRKIFISLLFPVLLWSCSDRLSDPVVNPLDESPEVFYAVIESGEATRAVLGDDAGTGARSVTWSLGDKINIGKAVYETMATASGEMVSAAWGTAFFGSGAVTEGSSYKAYYPSTLRASDGSTSLPQTQTLVYEEGKVRIDHLPMHAQYVTGRLVFGNMCSVLEICLTGEGSVGYIDVESLSGQRLWGPFSITNFDWNSASPYNIRSFTYSMTGTPSANYAKVTLDCTGVPGGGVQLDAEQPTSFYVAIPVGTYGAGDLKITVRKPAGTTINSFTSKAQLVTERNKLYKVSKEAREPYTFAGLIIAPGDLYDDNGTLKIAETWDGFTPQAATDATTDATYFSWQYLWENVLVTDRVGTAYNTLEAATGTIDLPLRGETFTWRLPTVYEWSNIVGTDRTGSTVNNVAGWHYAFIRFKNNSRYSGVSQPLGVLLFPDGVTMSPSYTLPYHDVKTAAGINTNITVSQLNEYLDAGCAFLPCAGRYVGSNLSNAGTFGFYWSGSSYDAANAYYMTFDSGSLNPGFGDSKSTNYFSVRLVREP